MSGRGDGTEEAQARTEEGKGERREERGEEKRRENRSVRPAAQYVLRRV